MSTTLLNYFEFEGKRYPIGTKVTPNYKHFVNLTPKYAWQEQYDYEITITRHTVNANGYHVYDYTFVKSNGGVQNNSFGTTEDNLNDYIDTVVTVPEINVEVVTQKRPDREVEGVMDGWLWYVLIMLVSIIFVHQVGLWAIASAVFFKWRKKKTAYRDYNQVKGGVNA